MNNELVYLAFQNTCHGTDILRHLPDECSAHFLRLRIAVVHHLIYVAHVVGAAVSIETAAAYDLLIDFLLGILSGETHPDQRSAGHCSRSLR